jgi:hypothetical protein
MLLREEQRAAITITLTRYILVIYSVFRSFSSFVKLETRGKKKKKLKFGGMDGWMGGGEDTLALWSQIALMYFQ